jgi:two-component system, NtrC family, response regulator HydG
MGKQEHIIIIDDDVDICALLKRFFERKGYAVSTAFKAQEGLELIRANSYDVLLTDFRLPDMDGLEVIKNVRTIKTDLPIIVITGYSDVAQAIKAIRLGAYEYVTKPIYPEEILLHVQKAITSKSAAKEVEQSIPVQEKSAVSNNAALPDYISGKSVQSQRVRQLIDLVAPTDMTVVILGESGTGKEVAARMIHQSSKRKDAPFVTVDCGALPQEIAGSELFGHTKGSFTGAIADKKGQFEIANGGTLFLDEIGNLSYENQIKLLRVLQERTIRRLGSEKDQSIDVRIIVATNEDLQVAMEKGNFREDIYHRLNEFKIELPSLRDSKEDIEIFCQFFLEKANNELNRSVLKIDTDVMDNFKNYPWPGNIRELKNVVRRSVLLSTGDSIQIKVLPSEIMSPATKQNSEKSEFPTLDTFDLKTIVEDIEARAIRKALDKTAYNKSRTAALLGIDRKTLYNKMAAYGIK